MSDTAQLPGARQPVLDPSGAFTRTWFLFLQTLFDRVGGPNGASTADVDASLFEDAGSAEVVALANSIAQALGQAVQTQVQVATESLTSDVNQLTSQVAELQKQLDGINQGTML